MGAFVTHQNINHDVTNVRNWEVDLFWIPPLILSAPLTVAYQLAFLRMGGIIKAT